MNTTSSVTNLFDNNRDWADRRTRDDPSYFQRLAKQQSPKYLWIGCSDSRVPANEIVGLDPGELFVHRNIANVVVHTDFNCLSVLQFAIDVLEVEHVMVVGHYGCGGVRQTMCGGMHGVADNWLRHIEDVQRRHQHLLEGLPQREQEDLMCELNVLEQVRNVCRTTIVRDTWNAGRDVTVHGWVYGLKDGLLVDLGWSVKAPPADLDAAMMECIHRRANARAQRQAER